MKVVDFCVHWMWFSLVLGCSTPVAGSGAAALDAQTTVGDAPVPADGAAADGADALPDTADTLADTAAAPLDTQVLDAKADAVADVVADAVVSGDGGACNGNLECDDGDPCTNGDFCLLGKCVGYGIPGCCTKKCGGKTCGPDGCGGYCGSCPATQLCDNNGTCVDAKASGDTCASPTVIGSLPFKTTAQTTGLADDYHADALSCGPWVLGMYAPDAVYRFTPTKDGTLTVQLTGTDFPATAYAVTNCADIKDTCLSSVAPLPGVVDLLPFYVDVKKGQDVFLIVDGDAKSGFYTLDVSDCTPDCAGKQCGWDGCGKNCGECPMAIEWNCSDQGQCVCTGSCTDKACGTDGCNGTCGTCAAGKTCDLKGKCVAAGLPGDTCQTAIQAKAFPFDYDGDTAGYGDDSYAWASCQGNGTGAYIGDGAPDMMFSVKPAVNTTYYGLVTGTGNQVGFYARSNCSDPLACLQAGFKGWELKDQLFIEAPAGVETWFVVDSYMSGSLKFHIHLDACPSESSCAEGEPGAYCSVAIPIGPALPASIASAVSSPIDSYFLPKGACGALKDVGSGGQNTAYSFTAPQSGSFTVAVQGADGMDPAIYIASDCTKLAATCKALADKTGVNGLETAVFSAQAGETLYIVVDNETTTTGSYKLTVK